MKKESQEQDNAVMQPVMKTNKKTFRQSYERVKKKKKKRFAGCFLC